MGCSSCSSGWGVIFIILVVALLQLNAAENWREQFEFVFSCFMKCCDAQYIFAKTKQAISIIICAFYFDFLQDISEIINPKDLCTVFIRRTKVKAVVYIIKHGCSLGVKIKDDFSGVNVQRIEMPTLSRCAENDIALILYHIGIEIAF